MNTEILMQVATQYAEAMTRAALEDERCNEELAAKHHAQKREAHDKLKAMIYQLMAPNITDDDANLLTQAVCQLEEFSAQALTHGNTSENHAAACSAHAVQKLAVALMSAQRCTKALVQIAEPARIKPSMSMYVSTEDYKRALAEWEAAAAPQEVQPFGYVNTYTGQFFKDVEPSRKNNEGHWRTVYTHPTQQGLADLRWQIVHDHISGEYIAGRACFVLRIPALPGANIMRGSVAEHFTKAVDAIAAQAKQGGV